MRNPLILTRGQVREPDAFTKSGSTPGRVAFRITRGPRHGRAAEGGVPRSGRVAERETVHMSDEASVPEPSRGDGDRSTGVPGDAGQVPGPRAGDAATDPAL